jgi:hypothetical protein
MREYDTSSSSSGPYAIWVDIHDNVWFSMTGMYKVGKFDQSTQTLQEYDLPTPRTIIRFIYADHEGNVWFPNNNNNKIDVILAKSSENGVAETTVDSSVFGGYDPVDGYYGRYFKHGDIVQLCMYLGPS